MTTNCHSEFISESIYINPELVFRASDPENEFRVTI
jgi:hypothetical protein